LTQVEQISHDSFIFRFALPHAEQPLGLPVGQHVFVRLARKDTGEVVQRAYTPVSWQDVKGSIDFLIKLYLPSALYPQGGKMTIGFSQLLVGDKIELKGPLGSFQWKGQGTAIYKNVPRRVKEVGMVAGGSGITPILQVLRSILHDPSDTETRIWLLDANRTEADILCRAELNELQARHSMRFVLNHTLTSPPLDWSQGRGRITYEMLVAHLPPPSPDGMVLACGPLGMITDMLKPGLQRCGWDLNTSLVVF